MLPIDDIGAFDTVIRHPQLYRPEQSERERHRRYQLRNPPIKLKDQFNYIDCIQPVFPFFIDAKQIVFMGRIGDEPVSTAFTVTNPAHRSFWYKITTSSREMFKVSKPCGRLEKGEQVTIPVIFYPNMGRPKPFTQYLNVYALYDDSKIDTAYEAFCVEERLRPLKRRLYAEFVWHPNIAITQAYENGRILEMTRSHNLHMNKALFLELRKDVLEKFRKKEKAKQDPTKRKGKLEAIKIVDKQHFYKYPIGDATDWHRQRQLDTLFILHRNAINKVERTNARDAEAALQKTIANRNLSRVAHLVENPPKGDKKTGEESTNETVNYQPLHVRSAYLDDHADVLWEELRQELGERSKTEYFQNFEGKETKLDHTTPEEREMKALLKEQKEEKIKEQQAKEAKAKKRAEQKKKGELANEENEKRNREKKEAKKDGNKVKKPAEEKTGMKVEPKPEAEPKDGLKTKAEPKAIPKEIPKVEPTPKDTPETIAKDPVKPTEVEKKE